MAIQKPSQAVTYSLQQEYASRVLLLTREVADTHNGSVAVSFGATCYPSDITYEIDANGNKVGVYETNETLPPITVSQEQLMTLFSIQVTLKDGTVSVIGEIIANFADQLIAKALNLTSDVVITTQPIDLSAVEASAPDPAPTPNPTPAP